MKLRQADRARLRSAPFVLVSTASASGAPYTVPLAFSLEPPWVICAASTSPNAPPDRRLLANIADNPQVALLVNGEDSWQGSRWIRIEGNARVLPAHEGQPAHRLSLCAAHPDYYQQPTSEDHLLVVTTRSERVDLADIAPAAKRVHGQRARSVLRWAQERPDTEFALRDCFSALRSRFPTVEALTPTLDLLETTGFLRRLPAPPRTGPGRAPSPRYKLLAEQEATNPPR